MAQGFRKLKLDFGDLPVIKRGIVFAEQANPDITQPEGFVAPHQKQDEPPAKDVGLASAGFSAIEHEVFFRNGCEKFTLPFSWAYQFRQVEHRRA